LSTTLKNTHIAHAEKDSLIIPSTRSATTRALL